MSETTREFSAPDASWPLPAPDAPESPCTPETARQSAVEGARAEEMFVPADEAGLVGVEHEDSEYEDEARAFEPLPPALTTEVDLSAPLGEDEPLPKGRFADREI